MRPAVPWTPPTVKRGQKTKSGFSGEVDRKAYAKPAARYIVKPVSANLHTALTARP